MTRYASACGRISIDSPQDIELNWTVAGARVDGKPWPAISQLTMRLPPGLHLVEAAAKRDALTLIDLNATLLRLLGFDHTKLTFRFQGRDFRLTDVHGNVVKDILA